LLADSGETSYEKIDIVHIPPIVPPFLFNPSLHNINTTHLYISKMSTSYSFYDTTIPTLRGVAQSAIGVLSAAKEEISKGNTTSEKDILDAQFGDMLPFRNQPIILAKFQIVAFEAFKVSGSAAAPQMDPSTFSSLDDVINFFKQLLAMIDAVDQKAWNEASQKSVDVPVANKTLTMSTTANYMFDFVIPNSYFHLNAMYMLLRSKGFTLGKGIYIGGFMTEQTKKDWAPLRS
jgi:hypothetical protein